MAMDRHGLDTEVKVALKVTVCCSEGWGKLRGYKAGDPAGLPVGQVLFNRPAELPGSRCGK